MLLVNFIAIGILQGTWSVLLLGSWCGHLSNFSLPPTWWLVPIPFSSTHAKILFKYCTECRHAICELDRSTESINNKIDVGSRNCPSMHVYIYVSLYIDIYALSMENSRIMWKVVQLPRKSYACFFFPRTRQFQSIIHLPVAASGNGPIWYAVEAKEKFKFSGLSSGGLFSTPPAMAPLFYRS